MNRVAEQKTYQCKKCDFTTTDKWRLGQHYRWKHPKGKKAKRKYTKREAPSVEPTHPVGKRIVVLCPHCATVIKMEWEVAT